jgi:hypothetical protein
MWDLKNMSFYIEPSQPELTNEIHNLGHGHDSN